MNHVSVEIIVLLVVSVPLLLALLLLGIVTVTQGLEDTDEPSHASGSSHVRYALIDMAGVFTTR